VGGESSPTVDKALVSQLGNNALRLGRSGSPSEDISHRLGSSHNCATGIAWIEKREKRVGLGEFASLKGALLWRKD
jgi:hypothetical protein